MILAQALGLLKCSTLKQCIYDLGKGPNEAHSLVHFISKMSHLKIPYISPITFQHPIQSSN